MDATPLEPGLAGVERALAITEGWRQAHGGEYIDRLDASVFATRGPLRDFRGGVKTLIAGAHQVQVNVLGRDFYFSVLAQGGTYTVDEVSGNVSVEVDGAAIQIHEGDDALALLDGCGAYICTIEVTLCNRPTETAGSPTACHQARSARAAPHCLPAWL